MSGGQLKLLAATIYDAMTRDPLLGRHLEQLHFGEGEFDEPGCAIDEFSDRSGERVRHVDPVAAVMALNWSGGAPATGTEEDFAGGVAPRTLQAIEFARDDNGFESQGRIFGQEELFAGLLAVHWLARPPLGPWNSLRGVQIVGAEYPVRATGDLCCSRYTREGP